MKIISITISDDLLKKLTLVETQSQGRVKINRSQLINKLIEEKLGDHETKENPQKRQQRHKPLVIEVNPDFKPSLADIGYAGKGVILPPNRCSDYWMVRIMLSRKQGIICFPEGGTLDIGFKESDSTAHLPFSTPAEQIYERIKAYKNDRQILDTTCLTAIKKLQELAVSQET